MTPEEFTARYMPQFSEQQKAAVRETEGPVLLLAVPGSGKTTVLVTRLGYMALCRGIDPAHILAVTYTVAATRELRPRAVARVGVEKVAFLSAPAEFSARRTVGAGLARNCMLLSFFCIDLGCLLLYIYCTEGRTGHSRLRENSLFLSAARLFTAKGVLIWTPL